MACPGGTPNQVAHAGLASKNVGFKTILYDSEGLEHPIGSAIRLWPTLAPCLRDGRYLLPAYRRQPDHRLGEACGPDAGAAGNRLANSLSLDNSYATANGQRDMPGVAVGVRHKL